MILTIEQIDSIYKLYPQVTVIQGDIAYDANGTQIAYDLEAVDAKAEADAQAVVNARQSALNKLMALGLTEEEALALGK